MILESIFNLIYKLLTSVFGILPNIPSFSNITDSIDVVFDTIFDNLSVLGVFIRPTTIIAIVPLLVAVLNFEHIYHFVMWIIKKLPVSIE